MSDAFQMMAHQAPWASQHVRNIFLTKKDQWKEGEVTNVATVVCESALTLHVSPGDTEVKLTCVLLQWWTHQGAEGNFARHSGTFTGRISHRHDNCYTFTHVLHFKCEV